MNAYYFGTRERRLFGVYEAARGSLASRSVVLCHPWGDEYIHAYRAMRQLSKMLSANGFHTLRFDYFGTGDSDGDTTVGELSGWETDIQSAIKELKDTTNATQVSLVGLRSGISRPMLRLVRGLRSVRSSFGTQSCPASNILMKCSRSLGPDGWDSQLIDRRGRAAAAKSRASR